MNYKVISFNIVVNNRVSINDIFEKFSARYYIKSSNDDDNGIRYVVYRKTDDMPIKRCNVYISSNLSVLNLEAFFPQMEKEEDNKYLSAAVFYMVVANASRFRGKNRVLISAEPEVVNKFYSKMEGFSFKYLMQDEGRDNHHFYVSYIPDNLKIPEITNESL